MRLLSFFLILMSCSARLMACTGILMQAENGSAVNGRTLEFGIELDTNVAVIPRNMEFFGKTPLGKGLAYKSKYAAVGAFCFDDIVIMDGMNEKGLTAAAFYFPHFASYAKVTNENQAKALSPADFPHWILTQFATLDEVKAALNSVVIAPTVLNGWGNEPPPMHYIVYDQKGKSIVIEPLEGTLKVYENELGVITNSPTFDWQVTNLNNYINLSPVNVDTNQLRGLKLFVFGQGTGMIGLPGDFTPPSRFVRAAFFSSAALPVATSDLAVDQTFHILNQFDIPLGVVRQKTQGKMAYDYTMLTSVKNPETLEYFYRSYQDQAIQFVDLRQFDFNATAIKKMEIAGKQKKSDVSAMLK